MNDLDEQAHELAALLRDVPCKINLIPFNPFPGSGYRRPEVRRVDRFRRLLQEAGYVVTVRSTRGKYRTVVVISAVFLSRQQLRLQVFKYRTRCGVLAPIIEQPGR